MSGDDQKPRPSVRPSRVDAGWEEVPSVVPEDTVLDPSVDSRELTSPHPSQRFSDLGVPIPRRKTVIGLAPPGAGAPTPSADFREAPTAASSGPSMQTLPRSSSGLMNEDEPAADALPRSAPPPAPSAPPPPPSARYPSAPPPPPPPAARYPSTPPPAPSARYPSAPPPPAAPPAQDGDYDDYGAPPPDYDAPPPDYGAPPPPPSQQGPGAPLGPGRKPYDSLESIHTVSDFVSTSSLTTDPNVELESLEATQERPGNAPVAEYFPEPAAESDRPAPPSVQPPTESSGTRELRDIQAPPIHLVGESASAASSQPPESQHSPVEPASDEPQPLVVALKKRVRLGSGTAPLWGVVAGGAVVLAAVVMLLSSTVTALIARRGDAPASAPTPTAATAAAPAVPSPSAPPAPTRELAGSETWDTATLSRIEEKPQAERTTVETMTLAQGRRAQRRAMLAQMRKDLAGKEPSAEDVKLLRSAVTDGEAGYAALVAMAALAGPAGPDLIYEAWTKPRSRTPTTKFAEALVYSREVRAKASPALGIALDLRAVKDCEQAVSLVEKAKEIGDRRALYPLSRLTRKSGCGAKKRNDCFPCLGKRKDVVKALRASGRRPKPRY